MATNKHKTSAALVAIASVAVTAFVVATLYVARDILIPIALAGLLCFMLAPLVTRLERWVGRVAAVLVVVAAVFTLLGGVSWILTKQVLDLAERLPDYKGNIQAKLKVLNFSGGGRFTKLSETVDELKKDLPSGNASQPATAVAANPSVTPEPLRVQVVDREETVPLEQIGIIAGPLMGPLGTAALVLLLLVCMLLQRENLRGRLIRLIGKGNISATTRGMDDAASRVARYLLMQLIVNATYGVAVSVGLYFIGVPSALVWGVLATVLRFIPYVGPWIAAAFPVVLSLAVSDSWAMPLMTIGLFAALELLSNNVMEPMLYGSSTGVSAIALIIAAVFWTWLWGAAGLVLATPLTVCLVVIGRHVPNLSMLSVLLSDEEALAPHEEFYHRLLTPSANDAAVFADSYLAGNSQTALCDSVVVPALIAIERDYQSGELEAPQHRNLHEELREIIRDLGTRPSIASRLDAEKAAENATESSKLPVPTCRVLCLPARADRDELAGSLLAQILQERGFSATCLSGQLTTGELIEAVDRDDAEIVCISVIAPTTVIHARYLCGKLRAAPAKLRIIVGLWGATEDFAEAMERLRASGADEVVTSLSEAAKQITKHAASLAQEAVLLAPSSSEPQRLLELAGLHLLDTEPEPVFDRITSKLTRILNVPIALVSLVGENRQFFKSQCGLPPDLAEARGTSRDLSVCSQVVISNEPLIVEDLARDRRFADNPLLREKKLRFYAGVPLRTRSGQAIGALCVLDHKPRAFTDNEQRLLEVTAEEVMEVVHLQNRDMPQASAA